MRFPQCILFALGAFAFANAPAHAALLLQYNFDDVLTSTTTANTGAAPGYTGTLNNSATFTNNTPSGSGRALSTGDGANRFMTTGTGTDGSGTVAELGGLSAFTITGWMNLQGTPVLVNTSPDRLVSNWTSTGTFDLTFATPTSGVGGAANFRLLLTVGVTAGTSTANIDASTKWLFFAVTYDSAATGSELNFYTGTDATAVSQLGTSVALAGGVTPASAKPFQIAGSPATTNDRTAPGFYDDIRVYDEVRSDLESIRASNVPEPSAAVMLLGGAGTLALLRRRRRVAHR